MSIKKIPLFKTDTLNFLSADDPDLTAITALSVSTVTTTGTEVTVDESAGLQNATDTPTPAGDADDNDTNLTLPTVFSTALAAQTLVGPMLQAALSGYDGANTGLNVITISPSTTGQVPEIGFTLADGEGTDSGLVAIFLSGTDYAYRKIFLYTDPDNDNIVYGRAGWDKEAGAGDDTPDDASDDTANPNGEIVFAIYLEETGTPVTGAKIWTTLYAPLMHGDTTSYDEAVDLTDKVYISAKTDFEVDLSNAPSGQNLFLMFTKANPATYDDGGITRISDPAIIATGRDPADQSAGIKITEGDTINTSKGGGPTTFGTNNQMIVEGEGITFTFVTGANQNYTVPYEDQNEADVEANIDFTGVFNVNQAQFDVVQLQSGKSAVVLITALNTSTTYKGATFIDGYAHDSTVEIDVADVQVWKGGVDITASLTLTQVGDSVRISGVTAGSTIVYSTDDTHNRLLVSHDGSGSGNASADFDIGGFKLTDITTENVEIGSKINFEDDGPGETLAPNTPPSATIFFDDTDLQSGPQSELQSYTVAFTPDDQSGIEGPVLSSSFAFTAPSWAGSAADSGLLDTLSGNKIYLYWDINTTTGDGEILARVGTDSGADPAGAVAFKWVVDTQWAGDTPTQVDVTAYFYRAILHDDVNDHHEANDDGTNAGDDAPDQTTDPVQQELAGLIFSIVRTDTLTDADGDTFEVSSDPLIIAQPLTFFDDGPSFDEDLTAVPTLTTDDTDIPDSAGPTNFAGLFTPDYGKDGFLDADDNDVIDDDALVYALGVKDDGTDVASGLYDTLTGDAVVLNKVGDDVVGTVMGTSTEVFRITVNQDTGEVSLSQSRSVVHDDPLDPDESTSPAGLAAADLVTLTATITDGDMDTASDTRNIGDAFKFEDDGPSFDEDLTAVPTLTTDDTDIPDSAGPTNFAGLFTPDYGKDGFLDADDNDVIDDDALVYALGVKDDGTDVASGLYDTLTGDAVVLNKVGDDVVGTVMGTSTEVFRITVNQDTGEVSLSQSRSVVHDDPLDPDESTSPAGLAAADLVTLTATITDGDMDTASDTRNIGDAFKFEDDGPSFDEDLTAVPTLTTDDTDIPDSAGPTNFAGLFTPDYGKDGFLDADDNDVIDDDALVYALGVKDDGTDVASGLYDTLTGDAVVLNKVGDDVVGTVMGTSTEVFRITVNQDTGEVSLSQSRSVVHDDPLDPDESTSPAGLSAADLVTLTATITDGDMDTASDTRNIGDAFKFEDDGPSFDEDLTAVPTLTTDDTDIPDSAGPTSFANLFTPDYGKDGFLDADDNDVIDDDALVYALGVKDDGTDVASGLYDTLTGLEIVLNKEGDDVVGRAGTGGAVVFTISVNTDTGAVSITQSRAIMHDDINDHDEANDDGTAGNDDPAVDDAAIQQTMAANLITLTATITDGDYDTASSTRNIGDAFLFLDDGPDLAFGNLVGTGTLEVQHGVWSQDPGADGAAGLELTLENFYLVNGGQNAGTSFTFAETATPGLYHGSLTGDFDHDAATPDNTVEFNLTVNGDGSYDLQLLNKVESIVEFSSADGKLDAGGPDPVRTLTIPDTEVPPAGEQIVFFGVKASSTDVYLSQIKDAIGPGEDDLTELEIQNHVPAYTFIGTANMNVSTSGIGVGNNNMNGDNSAGITNGDETFVVNPETLMTKVTVYIDNSVQGYDPATEELYYRIFYADGSVSDQMLVEAGDLQTYTWAPEFVGDTETATEKLVDGLKYLEIIQEAGETSLIDAVQITMGLGVTKIPVIEFTQATNVVASDIELDFTAKLTDGDGDWVTSDFLVNLFANDLGTTPDFTMMGTDGEMDSFNVDLTELIDGSYGIVDGFDKPADQLLLLGDALATFELTNPIAGSTRITVTESDADITIIDVVGVVLETTDIVIIG